MDPVTHAKHATMRDEHIESDPELPLLLPSMAVEGLPPFQQSMYVHEAEKLVMKYLERWQIISFDSYCLLGLYTGSCMNSGVISLDRLVAISILNALMFLLDDLFIDTPDEFLLDQYGIDRSARDSPRKMKEYLDNLNTVFSQKSEPPHNSAAPIEMIVWELGRDMLRLSNPEWFTTFVENVVEHHRASVESHADIAGGHNLCLQDLESYSRMRAGNLGGKFINLVIEFASDTYLPTEMRSHPIIHKATDAATMHMAFVNDIYSYHKESMVEENPRNVITVLMESGGKSFVHAVRAAIGLVNSHARTILDLELETSDPAVQCHLQGVKELIVGTIYFSSTSNRYRQPDSVFPELRDVDTQKSPISVKC